MPDSLKPESMGICKRCSGACVFYHGGESAWWRHLTEPEDEHTAYVVLEDVPKFTIVLNAMLDRIVKDMSGWDEFGISPPETWGQVVDALSLWKVSDE